MFLRLCQTKEREKVLSPLDNAMLYINRAKKNVKQYSRSRDDRCAFLCGNAGIYAVSAGIANVAKQPDIVQQDLGEFAKGFEVCKPINFNKFGSDEILVGRAGYLSGVYWLNKTLPQKPFGNDSIIELCESIVRSGREYSKSRRSAFPLMYQYHSTEYLGAAHGLSGILHMLLESPWFDKKAPYPIPKDYEADIKNTIDAFLGEYFYKKHNFFYFHTFLLFCLRTALQDTDGNFPCDMQDAQFGAENILVHWCHGASGAIYLFAKAYMIFGEEKYLNACKKAADLVWTKGLLLKGPGICHGVAGNGYVFLLMYRLTDDPKYLYRANSFANFLVTDEFKSYSNRPDCPWSLFEGLAGTVCYLIDMIHNKNDKNGSLFPFMHVF